MAPMTVRNPVTGQEEPYFPENKRFHRTLTGCIAIIVMVGVGRPSSLEVFVSHMSKSDLKTVVQIVVVLMFLISIILYRTILQIVISKSTNVFISSFVSLSFMLTSE